MIKTIKLLIIIGILSSCTLLEKQREKFSLPGWYLNPPQNNSEYLYGVGYGYDLDQAQKSALNDVAQKIQVTISSSFKSTNQESRINDSEIFNSRTKQKILSESEKISFTKFQIDKSKQINDQIYVLLSVDRAKLISDYKTQIRLISSKIANKYQLQKNNSIIKRKILFNKILWSIDEITPKLYIYQTLSGDNDLVNKRLLQYEKYQKEHDILTDLIIFRIVDAPGSDAVADVIKKNLNLQNIKISNVANSKNHVNLFVRSKVKVKEIYNSYTAKMVIDLRMLDNYHKQIAANQIEVAAHSTLGKSQAIDAVLKKFDKQILEQKIFKILGLE